MIQIKDKFRNVLHEGNFDSIKDCVEDAVKKNIILYRANLCNANLDGASLDGASLDRANLYRASLDGANLNNASLYRASLDRANLGVASLYSANLGGANLNRASLFRANLNNVNLENTSLNNAILDNASLDGAKYSLLSILRINFTELSDELTLELMRHDAEFCGEDKMNAWAKGGTCPYEDMYRDFYFAEKRDLWKPGKPKLRGLELWRALAKEKNIKISV